MNEFVLLSNAEEYTLTLQWFFADGVQGRYEQVRLREVTGEVERFLRNTGTQAERDREARQLVSLVGITLLVGETLCAVKKGALSPLGTLGKLRVVAVSFCRSLYCSV